MTRNPELLRTLVAAGRAGKAESVIRILVPRMQQELEGSRPSVDFREPFERFRYDVHGRDDAEAMVAATLAVLSAWAENGAPLSARVAALDDVSGVLRSR